MSVGSVSSCKQKQNLRKTIHVSFFGGFNQRIRFAVAQAPEVVVVNRPEHDAAEILLDHKLRLLPDDVLVVVADPLIAAVRVRTERVGIRLHYRPIGVFLLQTLTDFVIGEVAFLARRITLFTCRVVKMFISGCDKLLKAFLLLLTWSIGRRSNLTRVGIEKRVRTPISRNSQHQLAAVGSSLHVVVDC